MPDSLISDRLRSLKEEHGLTNLDLARALGVTQPTVSRWISGKVVPPREQIEAISEYFGVPVAYMSGFVDDKSADINGVMVAINAVRAARKQLDDALLALEKFGIREKGKVTQIYRAADGGFGPDKPHKDGCHSRVACTEEKGEVYSVDGERADLGFSDDDGGQGDNRS